MADDNEYELLPHKLLEDLKFDVEALKKRLTDPDTKSNELILEIETLKDSIHELNIVFKDALEETKEEDVFKSIQLLNERLDAVVTQNETIAKGMIAISDKLEDFMSKGKPPMGPRPIKQSVVTPSPNSNGAPVPTPQGPPMNPAGMPPSPGPGDMPPPPPSNNKRKGLF